MTERSLKIHSHPAPNPNGGPPLLFVHGAYTHALCWQVNFIPWFTARGYDCHALDLSGHGQSEGHDQLHEFGLADYAQDLKRAVDALGTSPVLVGHSMGTLVVQRYLSEGAAAGVALLAPVPPTGTVGSAARLALSEPDFFAELPNVIGQTFTPKTLDVMARVYFSPEMPRDNVEDYLPMIQNESDHAVAEMATLAFQPTLRRQRIPALVVNGREDRVFPPDMLFFTALPWQARQSVIDGAGHMLMLDPQWEEVATTLANWLEQHVAG
ncbi:alpha/beta hydrolase [Zoogloea sp.]|uniref:alpha/beta hydrolase n=1 Tax=Zoogloea sp. TaxID=49181 RepID=UPI00262A0DA8|nr:alpha/beta hydrolase [Zoogloea sp.]MDD3354009.1 alpha/beta hydrolase [Zoogloea sp.]